MNAENNLSQMRRGLLELCIIAIIRSQGEAYATDIHEALQKADLLVVEGTLYPLLTRLKNEGLLTYRWVESRSGPPRKYYTVTKAGLATFDLLYAGWQKLSAAVETILHARNNSSKTFNYE